MKFLLIAIALFLPTLSYGNYERMRESLEPVSDCQWVVGAIVHEAVYINLYCPEHTIDGWLVRVQKSLYIDLVGKTRKRTNERFELLWSNQNND